MTVWILPPLGRSSLCFGGWVRHYCRMGVERGFHFGCDGSRVYFLSECKLSLSVPPSPTSTLFLHEGRGT